MASFKQKRVGAAYSPIFAVQAALGTALDASDLTGVLPLRRDARPLPTRRVTREETRDCRGRYLIGRRLTSRLALWSLSMDATAHLLAGFLALARGVDVKTGSSAPYTHTISTGTSDQPPGSTFIIGTDDPDDDQPNEVYKDMVVNRVRVAAEVRGKVTLDVDFIGSADVDVLADEDVTFAACVNPTPIYAEDCLLTINSVNRTADIRTFEYVWNNNLLSNDDPFTFDSVDLVRLERNIEDSAFTFALYGSKAHAVYVLATAESVVPVSLRIGESPGDYTAITAANCQLTLADTDLGYAGEANRSVINLAGTPLSVSGAQPDGVVGTLAQSAAFLTVPA